MTIVINDYSGQDVAVVGLGKSGCSAAAALAAGGADVWAWDDLESGRLDAESKNIPVRDAFSDAGANPAALVLSPGVPFRFPEPHRSVTEAQKKNIPVLGDVELLYRAQPDARYIGITGTNGKSTTTALIGHILQTAGRTAEVGGNLGTPPLDLAPLDETGTYVLELSSYQLDLVSTTRFDITVLLNISPDHLDRHGGIDGYVAAKARIFDRQGAGQTAVIGIDDARAAALADAIEPSVSVIRIATTKDADVCVRDGNLVDCMAGQDAEVLRLADAGALPGLHNAQNMAAAYAVCRTAGLAPDEIVSAIKTFPGLPHRLQTVGSVAGIRFVNDSKATNAEAAGKALSSFPSIYWVAGGREKQGGYDDVIALFDHVRAAFLIGEASENMMRVFESRIPCHSCGTLDVAVRKAFTLAKGELAQGNEQPVVLLSPACASFDQFPNFEVRGEAFVKTVAAIAQQEGAA
ncbi:MAG: UDP-N-acetylmuramoyl-L-alanine--D-glutamate ligase [Alphaproteobacteria bacterium]